MRSRRHIFGRPNPRLGAWRAHDWRGRHGSAKPMCTGDHTWSYARILVGGLEHEFHFSIYWEESSQLTNIFQWLKSIEMFCGTWVGIFEDEIMHRLRVSRAKIIQRLPCPYFQWETQVVKLGTLTSETSTSPWCSIFWVNPQWNLHFTLYSSCSSLNSIKQWQSPMLVDEIHKNPPFLWILYNISSEIYCTQHLTISMTIYM